MAILAHHSFPDEFELANGVATLTRKSTTYYSIDVVTQAGAASVTNPEPGQLPELATGFGATSFGPFFDLQQQSNLVQLGDTVMDWPTDYAELARLSSLAAERFALETGKTSYVLEFIATEWVMCAYNPPWDDSELEDEEGEDEAIDRAEEAAECRGVCLEYCGDRCKATAQKRRQRANRVPKRRPVRRPGRRSRGARR